MSRRSGRRDLKVESRRQFSKAVNEARRTSIPYDGKSAFHQCLSRVSCQTDPNMDVSIVEEPMHECALGRHHVRISFCLLLNFLLLRKLWAIVAGHTLSDTSAMGRRIESVGLFEHCGLGSINGGISAGCCGAAATSNRVSKKQTLLSHSQLALR